MHAQQVKVVRFNDPRTALEFRRVAKAEIVALARQLREARRIVDLLSHDLERAAAWYDELVPVDEAAHKAAM